jgi:uncharacterized metal-binding protein YceD (DUF177 family)
MHSPYIIRYAGLPEGNHAFNFQIDKLFFQQHNDIQIHDAQLNVAIALNKQFNLMILDFHITGTVTLQCDRCTEDYVFPVEIKKHVIVKPVDTSPEDADQDEIIIADNNYQLDTEPHIFDFVELSLPMKHVHPDDDKGKLTCNKKTLKEIEKHLINKEPQTDTRWEALKKFNPN